MHYYQHHIGDFIKDTANLNDHQVATYMRMLWGYYSDEQPFADDCEGIAFAVRSDEKTVRRLLSHYFVLGDDGWRHKRCDKEIAAYHGKAEKARQSANARWNNANALRTHSDRNANEPVLDANQEPITKNHKDQKPSSSDKPTTTHAERLAQVTRDATETFNESKLVKPNGGLLATVTKVGNETRQKQVRKCITVARQICAEDYGVERITREFWADYWAECHADDHKSGRSGGGREHPNWVPTFEYLTREKTMVEVYERAGR